MLTKVNEFPSYGLKLTGGNARYFYGEIVPSTIDFQQEWVDPRTSTHWIGWRHNNGSLGKCELKFPMGRDDVTAIIVAMKLSY